jgi:hypothetical protein
MVVAEQTFMMCLCLFLNIGFYATLYQSSQNERTASRVDRLDFQIEDRMECAVGTMATRLSSQYRPENDEASYLIIQSRGEVRRIDPKSLCWHCVEPVGDRSACMLPISYDLTTDKYTGMGTFCDPACAMGYAVERHMHNLSHMRMWLHELSSRWNGRPCTFGIAPPAYYMKKFGGPLDRAEFRARGESQGVWTDLMPSLIMTTNAIQSMTITKKTRQTPRHVTFQPTDMEADAPSTEDDDVDTETNGVSDEHEMGTKPASERVPKRLDKSKEPRDRIRVKKRRTTTTTNAPSTTRTPSLACLIRRGGTPSHTPS